jgi:hypothetical protein
MPASDVPRKGIEPEKPKEPADRRNSPQKQPDAAPKEIKKEKGTDNNHGKMLKQWPDVIECVRSAGKMKVYAYLLDTECRISDDKFANIVVPGDDGLKKTVLSRNDSVEVIKDAIQKTIGLDLTVKIIDERALEALPHGTEDDPELDRIKKFAEENNIPLEIQE